MLTVYIGNNKFNSCIIVVFTVIIAEVLRKLYKHIAWKEATY